MALLCRVVWNVMCKPAGFVTEVAPTSVDSVSSHSSSSSIYIVFKLCACPPLDFKALDRKWLFLLTYFFLSRVQ